MKISYLYSMKRLVIAINIILFAGSIFSSCNYFAHADGAAGKSNYLVTTTSASSKKNSSNPNPKTISPPVSSDKISTPTLSLLEQSIINSGLVDIKTVDSTFIVDLRYSTCDNFLCMDVYGDLNKCYLQPDVAEKLKNAHQLLKAQFPYYRLVVYDGTRPRSVQRIMWDTVKIPYTERGKFLSSPKSGSLHNFGAAVDIGIIDENGYSLDMGTPYDYFGELAHPKEENRLLKEGKLSYKQVLNRELLRKVMNQAGFWGIATEWWHFNSCSLGKAYEMYKIIE